FSVAGAMCDAVLHRDFDFIPVLRLVFFERLVRTGHEVVSTLELRLPDEDAAVRVDGRAEFQFETEVPGELAGRRQLPESGSGFLLVGIDGQDAIFSGVKAGA